MSYIADYLNDHLVSRTVNMIVDETLIQLKQRSKVLGEAMPVKEFSSRDFSALLVEAVYPIASLIGFGQEIPTVTQGSFNRVTAEMYKMGLSMLYDEHLQWKMYETMQTAGLKNIPVQDIIDDKGKVTQGENNQLALLLFQGIQRMAQGVMEKLNLMSWQVLATGQINLTDSRTNIKAEINYRDPRFASQLFPAALVATGNTTTPLINRWSDHANANGLQNLYDLVDTYIDVNGFAPDYFVMSRRLHNHLMQQQSTRDAAAMKMFNLPKSQGIVSNDMLKTLLEARSIPEIVTVEDRYTFEDEFKNTTQARFVNENIVIAIKKDVGLRALGPTIESVTNLVGEDKMLNPKAGIYVLTQEKKKSPPTDETLVVATGLPIVPSGRHLMAQVVN